MLPSTGATLLVLFVFGVSDTEAVAGWKRWLHCAEGDHNTTKTPYSLWLFVQRWTHYSSGVHNETTVRRDRLPCLRRISVGRGAKCRRCRFDAVYGGLWLVLNFFSIRSIRHDSFTVGCVTRSDRYCLWECTTLSSSVRVLPKSPATTLFSQAVQAVWCTCLFVCVEVFGVVTLHQSGFVGIF